MKELKKMLIDFLLQEYELEDAIRQIGEAEILIKGDLITVKYINGAIDALKVEKIVTEKLVIIHH